MVGLVGVIDAVINVARRDVFDNVTILGVNSNRCKDTLKISMYILAKDAFKRYFWSVFSDIRTVYRKIRNRNNSEFGHFSRNVED